MNLATKVFQCCVVLSKVLNLRKKYVWLRNNKLVILFLVFLSGATMYCVQNSSSVTFFAKPKALCYNLEEEDALDSMETLSPLGLNFFFIEASCKRYLTSRQACSIEAAARAHPKHTIYVLFCFPVSRKMLNQRIFARLRLFFNIKFVRVHIRTYARNSPLEELFATTPFYKNKFWIEHTSDIIRYLTLYKFGGIYLDTDTLVVKSLLDLGPNWIGKQDDISVNGAAMALSRNPLGRGIATALVKELSTSYKYDLFGHNGPQAITRVLTNLCKSRNVSDWSSESCGGFEVIAVNNFYPIYYRDVALYFNSSHCPVDEEYIYAHHFWNKISYNMKIQKGSLYMRLAEQFCPSIFQMCGEDFGT